jgi:hypothetical protein
VCARDGVRAPEGVDIRPQVVNGQEEHLDSPIPDFRYGHNGRNLCALRSLERVRVRLRLRTFLALLGAGFGGGDGGQVAAGRSPDVQLALGASSCASAVFRMQVPAASAHMPHQAR